MKNICLICGESYSGSSSYHPSCSRKFFGTEEPPSLEYDISEINKIAEETVLKSITLTGVQPKLSFHLSKTGNGKRKKLTIVGLWGAYILKPPSTAYPFLPENEHLTMHLAESCGIKTVSHALIRFKSGELAYITKRIDRSKSGKLHMEDMCQLQERLTEDKYRGSVEQIGKTIEKYSSNPGYDLQRLFEIAVFSFLTGNADMHLKNYSLFYRKPDMKELAPAYDLLNTALVIPEDAEESALTINGKKSNIKKSDFDKLSENLKIIPKVKNTILERIVLSLTNCSETVGHSLLPDQMKEKYMEIVQKRVGRF